MGCSLAYGMLEEKKRKGTRNMGCEQHRREYVQQEDDDAEH
jgi:hypothetical protein